MINKIVNKIKLLIKSLIFLFKFKLNRINTEDYQLEKIKYIKHPIKKKII